MSGSETILAVLIVAGLVAVVASYFAPNDPCPPSYTPPPEWGRYTRKRDGKRMVYR